MPLPAEPLFLELQPSRLLRTLLLCCHLLAAYAVVVYLPWWLAMPLLGMLLLSLGWQWWRSGVSAPASVLALRLHEEGYGMLQLPGESVPVRLLPRGFDAGGLQVLRFAALSEERRKFRVLILPDSLCSGSQAALRRCLYSCSALD